jgi:hypothetical protein
MFVIYNQFLIHLDILTRKYTQLYSELQCKRRNNNKNLQTQVDLVFFFVICTVLTVKYIKIIPHFSQQNARVGLTILCWYLICSAFYDVFCFILICAFCCLTYGMSENELHE